MQPLLLLALIAGGAIAIQAVINSKLAIILDNTPLATAIAFLAAFIVMISLYFIRGDLVKIAKFADVPTFIWLSGGTISALGVGLLYFLMPKLGAGTVMSIALTSQLICALVISHFGWLALPQKPIQLENIIGAGLMIAGLVLVNWKNK